MTRTSGVSSSILKRIRQRLPARAAVALALVSAAAASVAHPAVPRTLPASARTPERLNARTPERPNSLLSRQIVAISARYRGTPYRRDPLGEGPSGSVDRDPLFCATGVDCQTYVEQVLAEALAAQPDQVLPLLTRIRYRDGIIGFGTRNHYMVSDWLPHNRWLIRDRTGEVGGGQSRWMEKLIDRAAFFRAHGAPELGRGIAPQRDRTLYIPRAAVLAVAARIPDGSVLIWVQDRPGIIAAHCGFAVRGAGGVLLFRHASETRGRVLDEPLAGYLRRAPARIVGVKVCQAVAPLDMVQRPR